MGYRKMGRTKKLLKNKNAVQFKLASRSYKDPSYTDPNASPNILVPVDDSSMKKSAGYEERKKALMKKLGAQDLGVFKPEEENPEPIEAAMERRAIMKTYAKEQKKVKFATDKEMKEVLEEGSGSEDDFLDAKEGEYLDLIEGEVPKDPNYVVPKVDAKTLKQIKDLEKHDQEIANKLKGMKPNEGVKMVEYNEHGLPKDGTDYDKYFRFDETLPTDIVVKPPPDYQYPHVLIDEDKEYKDLTEEEKEIRACLEKEDSGDGDLEDDFVLKANGGVPALVSEEDSAKKKSLKDVQHKKAKISEKLTEEKKKQVPEKEDKKKIIKTKEEDKEEGSDEDMDEEFDEEIDEAMNEYEEGKEEKVDIDKISKDHMDKIMDEFIRKHQMKEAQKAAEEPEENEEEDKESEEDNAIEETPEEKKKLIEKTVELDRLMHEEQDNAGSDVDMERPQEADAKQHIKWDIETIASTYNNTDNRPKVLCEEKKENARKKERLAKKKIKEENAEKQEKEASEGGEKPIIAKPISEMTKEEKALYKKEIKAMKREKRKLKKDVKAAFQHEKTKMSKANAGRGLIPVGVSVKPLQM
eukprot:TRINITY_DN6390_c0_g1_i2.p1 TRINITY_DN6390_c0_g1~~TRINITY_DN6390_c0_g1_i2.p1  ORF type:complete len:617 (-),score=263.91 TRINITY_DN6390_c0_g1_i2:114-1856(-)